MWSKTKSNHHNRLSGLSSKVVELYRNNDFIAESSVKIGADGKITSKPIGRGGERHIKADPQLPGLKERCDVTTNKDLFQLSTLLSEGEIYQPEKCMPHQKKVQMEQNAEKNEKKLAKNEKTFEKKPKKKMEKLAKAMDKMVVQQVEMPTDSFHLSKKYAQLPRKTINVTSRRPNIAEQKPIKVQKPYDKKPVQIQQPNKKANQVQKPHKKIIQLKREYEFNVSRFSHPLPKIRAPLKAKSIKSKSQQTDALLEPINTKEEEDKIFREVNMRIMLSQVTAKRPVIPRASPINLPEEDSFKLRLPQAWPTCTIVPLLFALAYFIYVMFFDVSRFANEEQRYLRKMKSSGFVLKCYYFIMRLLKVPIF